MFGYDEDVVNEILSSIEKSKEAYSAEASNYKAQASQLRSQAASLRAKQEWTTESRTRTNSDGETESYTVSVRDYAAEAANRAQAEAMEAQAEVLEAVAAALMAAISELSGKVSEFKNAMAMVEAAINNSSALMNSGADIMGQIMSAFNLSETELTGNLGKDILSAFISDLKVSASEAIRSELAGLAEEFTKGTAQAGAQMINNFASALIDSTLGNGAIGNTLKGLVGTFTNIGANIILNNNTGARMTENTIVAALSSMGMDPDVAVAIMANSSNRSQAAGATSYAEAQQISKELYADYVKTLGYDSAKEQALIDKYNKAIDSIVVVPNTEFDQMVGNDPTRTGFFTNAFNNGPQDTIYMRESVSTRVDIMIHEAGGHGVGSMIPEEYTGYWYTDETGNTVRYEGDIKNATVDVSYGSIFFYNPNIQEYVTYSGIDEATTEYFTRRIYGYTSEDCAYNKGTDTLESIVNSLTDHYDVNGDRLLYDTYTGDDKTLFKNQYNDIMGEDAYDRLSNQMYDASRGDKGAGFILDATAFVFEQKGNIHEAKENFNEGFNNFTTTLDNAANNVNEGITNVANTIDEGLTNIGNTVEEGWNNLVEDAKEGWNNLVESGKELLNG